MAAPGDHLVHRVLTAIRTRTTLGTIPAGEAEPRSAYLRSPAEVARVFADDPESVAETARIAADCRVDLELGRRRLPRFTPPPGETAASFLEKTAMKGLVERLGVGAGAASEGGAPGDGGPAGSGAVRAMGREAPPAPRRNSPPPKKPSATSSP